MTYIEDYVNRLRQIQAATIMGSLPQPTVSKSDLANLILQRSRADTPVTMPSQQEEKKPGHGIGSVALGVIDKLSRPLYAVAEAADVAFNEDDNDLGSILAGAKRGITGEDQTSFIDVLQHQHTNEIKSSEEYQRILKDYGQKEADWYENQQKAFIQKNDIGAVVGGTITDFGLDPLNAVPVVGPVLHGANAVKRAVKIGTGLSKAAVESDALVEGAREVARETPTSDVSEAVQGAAPEPNKPGVSQDLLDKLRSTDQAQQEFP